MSYGWAEHVGELELWVEAADEPAVFAESLEALRELLSDAGERGEAARVDVEAEGEDRARLFAAWLEELAFLAETEGFVPEQVDWMTLDDGRVRARVGGVRAAPPHLIKAVTYHRLSFAATGDGWRATAILDV
jgi:SHS2 domain-containing protein